ncbi:MAG: hypothetical protein V9F00_15690 [Nocardioides sp.]
MLAFLDHFGIAEDDPRVNPYGGAIAMGHPLASSGHPTDEPARAPRSRSAPTIRYGLTTMCVGIGMGGTVDLGEPALGGLVCRHQGRWPHPCCQDRCFRERWRGRLRWHRTPT